MLIDLGESAWLDGRKSRHPACREDCDGRWSSCLRKKRPAVRRAKDARERIRCSIPRYRLDGNVAWGLLTPCKRAIQSAIFDFIDDCIIYFDVARRRMAIPPTSPSPASIMA